jgi:hypothetical protein
MEQHTESKFMIEGASAQVEIIESIPDRGDISSYTRMLALATFYWEGEQDWPVFVAQVTSVADRMFAEFNNEIENNVTQYIQFKTGGNL